MHVVLLTLMTLSGADVTAAQPASYGHCGTSACGSVCESACGTGVGGHASHYERKINRQLDKYMSGKRNGPMPQTCYAPRYGCYNGNDRHMHRYPAFHGTYYRRPYNYRNLFEYPWHAEMHEPTSYFSYNVPPEAMPIPQDAPPIPTADAAAQHGIPAPRPMAQPVSAPPQLRSASQLQPIGGLQVKTVAAPILGDQDLAGVSIEQGRVVPAPVETLDGATPFIEGKIAQPPAEKVVVNAAPAATTPRVASRPLSAGTQMLQPIATAEEAKTIAQPAVATAAPAELARPHIEAKPISLGKPVELKPLAPKSEVKQATADDADQTKVQATSAIRPVPTVNALRQSTATGSDANPLRATLRR